MNYIINKFVNIFQPIQSVSQNFISPKNIEDLIKTDHIIIIIKNKVYNITSFKNIHPGGSKCLINKNGTDCTIDFEKFHSKKAHKILNNFYIGNLKS